MTIPHDRYRAAPPPPAAPLLPFAPGELDRCGVRMSRAEFARLLGVSKQAVGEWVKSGKILLGVDGLLDPRQAVQQLLRNTDPARLRSKVLAPLVRDVGMLQRRIADLEAEIARVREDAEFHEGAAGELLEQWAALFARLRDEWCDLRLLPAPQGLAALEAWREGVEASEFGADTAIMDCLPAPDLPEEAAADAGTLPASDSPLVSVDCASDEAGGARAE